MSLVGALFKQQPRCSNSSGVVAYEEVTSQQAVIFLKQEVRRHNSVTGSRQAVSQR
ncbi:hypothetical protein M433DRAFT_9670 [Acidomyces richmondensis BFW]|nr:MAG: hypothetical protein FE78DRAFT_29022 [Acidomyces sp. 'richmondensis']KYG39893.1 hypothetical protein M433DRAFT_9670 [Acidomyces richmondensis BFW]